MARRGEWRTGGYLKILPQNAKRPKKITDSPWNLSASYDTEYKQWVPGFSAFATAPRRKFNADDNQPRRNR